MSSSLYRRMAAILNPEMMMWVLSDSFDHKAVVRLCNSCSLSYEGTRTKSIPTSQLIFDLVEEFYEDDECARVITRSLQRANADLIKTFKTLSPKSIETFIGDDTKLVAENNLGRVLFALASDERNSVNTLIREVERLASATGPPRGPFDPFLEEDESDFDEEEDLGDNRVPTDLTEETRRFAREASNLRDQLDKLVQQNAELEKRVGQLSEERQTLKTQIIQLQKELSASEKRRGTLEEEHTKLTQKREEVGEKGDQTRILTTLNQLARDHRKIQYHLDKWTEEHEKREGPGPFLEALGESISEIKEILVGLPSAERGRQGQIRKALEDLREEMKGLHTSNEKVQNVSKRSVRYQGELARVGVFVDVQNVFYAAKQFNSRVDFEKLLKAVLGERRLIKAIAYVVQSPEVDQSGFITMLQQKNYEVKRKDLRLRSDGSAKGDWDMGMAIDMISLADRLDVVTLVSGDGDFAALINLIKTMGPWVEVFSFPHNTAWDLIQAADHYYPIEESLLLQINSERS